MKYSNIIIPIVLAVILSSCATLNKSEIMQAGPVEPDKVQLKPHLDIYGERIDIVRKTVDREGGESGSGEDMPYHDAGFYLGNGLFYDLNGNLSILPFDLMQLTNQTSFTVRKINHKKPFNREIVFSRDLASFSVKVEKGIGFSSYVSVIQDDSVTELSKGKLGTKALILKRNGSYKYKQVLAGEDIKKTKNGYTIKSLLNTENYVKNYNEIYLNDDLVVKKQGKTISIYKRTWGSSTLLMEMKFAKNTFFIYNDKFRGLKFEKKENVLKVSENQKLIHTYSLINSTLTD